MNDQTEAEEQEPEPEPEPEPRHRRAWLLVGLGLVVVAVGAVAYLFLAAGEDGPSHPDEWAADVVPFVELVERERDLDFEHPVHVDFLGDDAFRAEVTADDSELTEEDRESLEQATGLLRALGLIEGDVDLFDAGNELSGEGTVGYYSHDTERITMRGTELTPASKVTLVHELTHALQDQHFDLESSFESLEESDDDAAMSAFHAIVEGDAQRIATAYRESLSEEQQAELAEAEGDELEEYEEGTEEVPVVLQTFQAAPYALGEAMLALVEELDGTAAIDELFVDPPRSEEHLLDPWTLLAADPPAVTTDPKIESGDEEFDRGTFGAMGWLVVLAERIPLVQALDATDGWGGDAYVAFERDGVSCVRISFKGDTSEDTDQMFAALQAWIAGLEGSPASVERLGAELRFESCDPGADVTDVGQGVSDQALGVALSRTYLTIEVLRSGATETQARCFGDALIHEYSLEQLSDPAALADPASQQRIAELALGCR